MRKTWISAGLACIAAATIAGHAAGQAWPAKPVRVVVTFPPGGSSDVVARQNAPLLAEKLGQSFVVETSRGPARRSAEPKWHAPRRTATR